MLSHEGSKHQTVKVNDKTATDRGFLFSTLDAERHHLCFVNGMSEKYAICNIIEVALSVFVFLFQGLWICHFRGSSLGRLGS